MWGGSWRLDSAVRREVSVRGLLCIEFLLLCIFHTLISALYRQYNIADTVKGL